MISKERLETLRKEMEESQTPLFFYDNDTDGFCAFLILRRALGRGKGVAIKSFPELKGQYLRKIDELNPDKVIILDKAEVDEEFIDGCEKRNVPIIWIDHHESKTSKNLISKTSYYNSLPDAEPTTYISQKVFNRKEDLWLAMIGSIGDVYMPEFAKDFEQDFPELFSSEMTAFETLHKTELGKMIRLINFGLMDTITNVVKLTKYLFKANGPYDLLEENRNTRQLHKRFGELNAFYNKQVEKARKESDNSKVIFFSYSGEISMSSQIANRLYYENPKKLIVVAYKRQEKANISIRGRRALEITKKVVENIEGATGGGHEEATGAMVPMESFEEFKGSIIKIVEESD